MPRFFICYRRHDSAYAAQSLCQALRAKFGKDSVFIDVHAIPLGVDFREYIRSTVTRCNSMLVLIGDEWLDPASGGTVRRLDDPRDFVRLEIASALAANVSLVPVLIGTARMPLEEQLPEDLKPLAFRQAAELRPGADYLDQLERLVRGLESLGDLPSPDRPELSGQRSAGSPLPTSRGSGALSMVVLPGGLFAMGSSPRDPTSYLEEQPEHTVMLTRRFELAVTPMTQMLFEEITGGRNPSRSRDPRRPVDSVTWFESIEFCNLLSEEHGVAPYYRLSEAGQVFCKGGTGFRLATEAEWEYACRGGSSASRFCEEAELERFAWFKFNSERRTHRVGRKEPNPWGLRDMLGNVWEWCYDWYQENYYSESPLRDPGGPVNGREKVLRGGSFGDPASVMRCANRYQLAPHFRQDNVGFRVARTVEE